MKKPKTIPFEFVLEELRKINPVVKPMFGCYAVYWGEQIVLILRKRESHTQSNGVWLATTHEHHNSLKKDFPSMRSITVFGDDSGWQMLPFDADDFEESVLRCCELILKRDPRIGKTPKKKKKIN